MSRHQTTTKPLFNGDAYNKDGLQVDEEFAQAIHEVMRKYHDQGCSLRELSYIAVMAVQSAETEIALAV